MRELQEGGAGIQEFINAFSWEELLSFSVFGNCFSSTSLKHSLDAFSERQMTVDVIRRNLSLEMCCCMAEALERKSSDRTSSSVAS